MADFRADNESGLPREAAYSGGAPTSVAVAANVALIDRVRWAAVIAGLFTALSTLAVLSVFGAAVGLSVWSAWDRPQAIGIGAGIWGVISSLAAFFVGGCVAAWSAANHRRMDGLVNGMMVWAVAIPLLTLGVLGSAGAAANNAAVQTTQMQVQAGDDSTPVYGNVADTISSQRRDMAGSGATAAWSALASLLLGLGAAAGGGYLGCKEAREERRDAVVGA